MSLSTTVFKHVRRKILEIAELNTDLEEKLQVFSEEFNDDENSFGGDVQRSILHILLSETQDFISKTTAEDKEKFMLHALRASFAALDHDSTSILTELSWSIEALRYCVANAEFSVQLSALLKFIHHENEALRRESYVLLQELVAPKFLDSKWSQAPKKLRLSFETLIQDGTDECPEFLSLKDATMPVLKTESESPQAMQIPVPRLDGLLQELGPPLLQHRDLLMSYLATLPQSSLTEKQLASVIGLIINPYEIPSNASLSMLSERLESLSLLTGSQLSNDKANNTTHSSDAWDLKAFCEIFLPHISHLSPQKVLSSLDYVGFFPSSNRAILNLIKLYQILFNESFLPVDPFLNLWENTEGQLKCITYLLRCPPTVVKYPEGADVPHCDQRVLKALLRLGASAKQYREVLDLLQDPICSHAQDLLRTVQLVFNEPIESAQYYEFGCECTYLLLTHLRSSNDETSAEENKLLMEVNPTLISDAIINACEKDKPRFEYYAEDVDFCGTKVMTSFLDNATFVPAVNAVIKLCHPYFHETPWSSFRKWISSVLHNQTPVKFSAPDLCASIVQNLDDFVLEFRDRIAHGNQKSSESPTCATDWGSKINLMNSLLCGLRSAPIPVLLSKALTLISEELSPLMGSTENDQPVSKTKSIIDDLRDKGHDESAAKLVKERLLEHYVTVDETVSLLEEHAKHSSAEDCHFVLHFSEVLLSDTRRCKAWTPSQRSQVAKILGILVVDNLLPISGGSAGLGAILKFVLQGIVRPSSKEVQELSISVLDAFKHRLSEWPQYCLHLLPAVPEIVKSIPDITQYLGENALKSLSGEDVPPPRELQDRVAFLFNNLDTHNIEMFSKELSEKITPPTYRFFADYLINKRIKLEPNYHRNYVRVLERMNRHSFDTILLHLSYASVCQYIDSEKIRLVSNERTILKNLGAWIGLLTLARDKPILAKDLHIQELLLQTMRDGKLIASVPFVAKILDSVPLSRIFHSRNPWVLSVLNVLAELYQLPDLRLTLRFEIEVLCNRIKTTVQALVERSKTHSPDFRSKISMIYKNLDLSNSVDFHAASGARIRSSSSDESYEMRADGTEAPSNVIDPNVGSLAAMQNSPAIAQNISTAHSTGITNRAEYAAPALAASQGPTTRPFGTAKVVPLAPGPKHTHIDPGKFHLPMYRASTKSLALKPGVDTMIHQTLENTFREVIHPILEKTLTVIGHTTREVTSKDFQRDPDDGSLRRYAQLMARHLTCSLGLVSCREPFLAAARKNLFALLTQNFPRESNSTVCELVDSILSENIQGCMEVVQEIATESASSLTETIMRPVFEKRRMQKASGTFPEQQVLEERSMRCITTLPDVLCPREGLQGLHKRVYDGFGRIDSSKIITSQISSSVDQLNNLTSDIEAEAIKHYLQQPDCHLGLTHQNFASSTLSPQHKRIKQWLCRIPSMISASSALQVTRHVFQKIVALGGALPKNADPAQSRALQLISETYLLILQSARDKDPKVVEELTYLLLKHEKLWSLKEITVSFIRLRLINIEELDRHLTRTLNASSDLSRGRSVVEFTGTIVQRCLVDEKLASQKNLKSTLEALEKIAQMAREKTGPAAEQMKTKEKMHESSKLSRDMNDQTGDSYGSKRRVRIPSGVRDPEFRHKCRTYFREWMHICAKKALLSTGASSEEGSSPQPTPQQQAMTFVGKLQRNGMIKADYRLEAFLTVLLEYCVENCLTTLCYSARTDSENQDGKNGGVSDSMPSNKEFTNKAYMSIDAYTDLIVLLIKCCGWGAQTTEKDLSTVDQKVAESTGETEKPDSARMQCLQAEVALVSRTLDAIQKVLLRNHSYFASRSSSRDIPEMSSAHEMQQEFQQQPYFRMLSNLFIVLFTQSATSRTDEFRSSAVQRYLNATVDALVNLSPQRVPGFAFGWLELVSHRCFLPKLLSVSQKGVSETVVRSSRDRCTMLLREALTFLSTMSPVLQDGTISNGFRLFHKALLRTLLILLHDFPNYMYTCGVALAEVIPNECIQLRNIPLAAFPRALKLPDPFTVKLFADQELPEMRTLLPFPAHYGTLLQSSKSEALNVTLSTEIQKFITEKQPENLPQKLALLFREHMGGEYGAHPQSRSFLPEAVISRLVHHVAEVFVHVAQNKEEASRRLTLSSAIQNAVVLLASVTSRMVAYERYGVFSALANHLRYPCAQTYVTSRLILSLYENSSPVLAKEKNSDALWYREQLTRVLLERVLVHRPHPWGLLVTFVELTGNRAQYEFWTQPALQAIPEMVKLLDAVGRRTGTAAKRST